MKRSLSSSAPLLLACIILMLAATVGASWGSVAATPGSPCGIYSFSAVNPRAAEGGAEAAVLSGSVTRPRKADGWRTLPAIATASTVAMYFPAEEGRSRHDDGSTSRSASFPVIYPRVTDVGRADRRCPGMLQRRIRLPDSG